MLIIGGGTGQVLEALDKLKIPLVIDFIEPSYRMIEKARKRSTGLSNLEVKFHQIRLQSFRLDYKYDWVCCFYFLDLFESDKLRSLLQQIKKLMEDHSHLIVGDFQKRRSKYWQGVLSKMMHIFFKLTADLESHRLKDIDKEVKFNGFEKLREAQFFSGFIFSAVYKKDVYKNGNHS